MEHSGSVAAVASDTVGVRRVMGDLPAWAPEEPDASPGDRPRARYGSLTAAGLILGMVTNLVAVAWQPTYRNASGAFSLPAFAFGNIGMFAVYLAVPTVAVWLCLRDGEQAPRGKWLTSVCTLVVLTVCMTPIAQYFHLFGLALEHPVAQSDRI